MTDVQSTHDAEEDNEDTSTLQNVIEKIGFGPTHIIFTLTGGGVWLADGCELLLISSITKSLAAEWNLDAMQRGSVVTIVYVGVLFGNLICGPLSDKYGRRHLILLSYAGIFMWSIISSCATSFLTLACWRFFVGFSFGLGQPPWNVLGAEVTPGKWRTVINALSQSLFTVGEVYSAILILLDDPSMNHLHWRSLLRFGAIPSIVFLAASALLLHQSPHFLAQMGRRIEAESVLRRMSRENCLPLDFPVSFRISLSVPDDTEDSIGGQLMAIWRAKLIFVSTIILMFTCFVLNFVYYGTLYAFPNVLPTLSGSHSKSGSAALQLLIGAFWELPGIALGCIFGMYFPRKPALQLYLLVTSSMLVLFAMGATGGATTISIFLYHAGYYGSKLTVSTGFIVAYIYVSETYPTPVRTTGTAMCFAAGRVAAMLSPLIYERLTEATGTFSTFFYVAAGLCFLNLLMIDFIPLETFNAELKDRMDFEEDGKEQ